MNKNQKNQSSLEWYYKHREEHPELELVESYMICYCSTHHRQWHRMRGDSYSEMIKQDYPNPDLELNSVSGRD